MDDQSFDHSEMDPRTPPSFPHWFWATVPRSQNPRAACLTPKLKFTYQKAWLAPLRSIKSKNLGRQDDVRWFAEPLPDLQPQSLRHLCKAHQAVSCLLRAFLS